MINSLNTNNILDEPLEYFAVLKIKIKMGT
jgi:hypothetical protein